MIIDTHCHIDLYENPKKLLTECEQEGIIVFAMTNLPSHFEMGQPFFLHMKNIRLSLGLHPLYAERHKFEYPIFLRNLDKTSYIGEIGLDFSREGISTKELQYNTLDKVLKAISSKNKILSIHSRKAEKEVLELLLKYKIKNAIFHWYSGSISLMYKILDAGYYFSVNPSMISSLTGQSIISRIPMNRLLTESDGPFIQIENRVIHPIDIAKVIKYISNTRNKAISEVEYQIRLNFNELIKKIL